MREGNSENEFLYCGEQYNALTGFYYLRARYMNPTTGTFISEDSYAGRMHEPVTLHKYLYAHANPVKYTDPSGYMADTMAATYLYGELSVSEVELKILVSIWALLKLNDIVKSSEAARFADFYQSDAQTNPEGAADDARSGSTAGGAPSGDDGSNKNSKKNKNGRGKNKLEPDKNATGAHSTFKRDPKTGKVINYKTYEPNPKNPTGFDEVKGYDGVGQPHYNKVTDEWLMPHVHDPKAPGKLRIPEPWEIPQ